MEAYKIEAELNLKNIIAELREVAQALNEFADNLERIEKKYADARGKNRADDVLDEVKAEILDEAEYAYADFDRYKEDVLHAEPDELPDDDFRYGMERAVAILNKYKAEREET